ncbi:MAG: LEA type 2 family protein [Deltaproteobacteria bacterium]|nr:LEA type 2 family protein [Deltaproteobacteria bacterium]
MLRNKFIRSFGLLAVTVMFAGCPAGDVKPDSKDNSYVKPALEYRGIRFENQSFTGMDVAWKFELISKDARTATLAACPYKLELDGYDPISGTIAVGGSLAGDNKMMVATSVPIPWPESRAEIKTLLDRKNISYSFTINCNINGPDGPLTVSAADSGLVPLPKIPQLSITGANAEKFTGKDIRLNFEMSILNENTFNVKVDKIIYKISVEGKPLSEGEIQVAESVPPSNEASYDISTGTLSGDENKEIRDLIKQPKISYHLEGEVFMGGFTVPVDDTGTVSFPR